MRREQRPGKRGRKNCLNRWRNRLKKSIMPISLR